MRKEYDRLQALVRRQPEEGVAFASATVTQALGFVPLALHQKTNSCRAQFFSVHLTRRSYSSWVPIQNQVTVSAFSKPTAR